MKVKRIKGKIAAAALLLALLSPCAAAYGQSDGPFSNANGKSDGFFSNAGGVRDGDVDGGQEATWEGMKSNESPVGGGLLVLTAAGLCYAGAKKVKRVESKE